MPAIKSSADLRNNYNEISTFCHNYPDHSLKQWLIFGANVADEL